MRKIKILTHVDRINWYINKWIDFHRNVFNPDELVFTTDPRFLPKQVLSEYLKEKGFKKEEINIIELEISLVNYTERLNNFRPFINNLQKKFLETCDVVIYLDIDELLYHAELREVLNTFNSDFLVTNTIDVIHNIHLEKDSFDFNKNVFSQRKFHNVSDARKWYHKPIITRRPVNWGDGRHEIDGIWFRPSVENVYIIHLGKMDFEYTNQLNKENILMREKDLSQNTFIDGALESFFLSMSSAKIPDNFLSLDI